ncbi:hypothetical protein JYU34_005401 [Plutella xylostella]|uniref:Uncharacterized protein n=1 Tax=Plutella xylostella TaxID=51655 RepID=A0ABQ7QWM3_PLUXY|nr:hypothetical protein JYU34_005401 [Plutella xylostella]
MVQITADGQFPASAGSNQELTHSLIGLEAPEYPLVSMAAARGQLTVRPDNRSQVRSPAATEPNTKADQALSGRNLL